MYIIEPFLALGITVLIIEIVSRGYIPHWAAALMLIIFVAFRAYIRAKGGVKSPTYWLFQAFFFGALVLSILLQVGLWGWQEIYKILGHMLFSGFDSLLIYITGLIIEGHPIIYMFILIFLLFIIKFMGLRFGNVFLYHTMFSFLAPISLFLIMLYESSNGNWRGAVEIGSNLLIIVVILEVFYILLYKVFSIEKANRQG